jgi:mannose-6-phosphate isomerase-like protein (cupin superfamily)
MCSRLRRFSLLGGAILAACASANAADLKEARVTQIVRDVKLLPNAAPARPAAVNDPVRDGTAVRTGIESRTELMFPDTTLARLGANTIFSFTEGTRNLELTDGAMLLRVPKNAGGAKINTAAVTAAITGTTVMLEFHKNSYVKFIVLEGTGRIFLPGHLGESVLVNAGQMLIAKPNAKNLPNPVDVDIRQLRKTSRLIRGFGKMGSEKLIAQTEAVQDEKRAEGELYETNLAIYGGGTSFILTDQEHIQITQISGQQNAPAPTEFGPPETITSPNPYPLGADNQLTTAGPPTVVANAKTNYGKVYRDTPLDGIRSLWFFRTTRPFDGTSGFDTPDRSVFDLNNIAVFKFQNLQLVSNPTISIPNGITKLGLVGVDGISSASSGGVLTFGGLNSVLLATQNGSIILGGGISFQNISNLFFYARGDSVALNLASPITGSTNLILNSEGTVQVNGDVMVDNFNAFSNGDFEQGNGIITAHDVTINSIGGNVTFDFSKFLDVASGTVDLTANGTLTIIPFAGPIARASIVGRAGTINFVSSEPFTFDFSNSSVSFTAGSGGIQAPNINFVGPNLSLFSDGDINLLASHVPVSGRQRVLSGIINAGGSIFASGPIEIDNLEAGHNIRAGSIYAGNIKAGGSITAVGGSILAGGDIISTTGLLRLDRDGNGMTGNISAGGNIFAGGGILASGTSSVIAVGNIVAPGVIAGMFTAGGNITIDNSSNRIGIGVLANTITAPTISFINTSTVSSIYAGSGNNAFSPHDFTMTVGSISSSGPAIPILFASGLNANSGGPAFHPGNGGKITLNITLDGLIVGGEGDFASIIANGGAFNASGPFTGGNGGIVNVTAAGPIKVDSPMEATTGYLKSPYPPSGNGGTVNLTSTNDSISVSSRIQVSSADPSSITLRRRSARGGNIALKSGKPSGVAINLSNTSELLSLLDAAAPGPGGKVTILATGASSVANINGKIAADRGTIDIRHTGDSGQIVLGGPGQGDRIDAHADVIKVAALGNNGVLTVGNGLLSADTTLKLYSPGSNGTVNFVADVTLGGASTKIIAGNTVNIFNGVVVTVGGSHPASVFTNNANYTGFGGNGSRTGTFGGAGANNPLLLNQAPSLDGPGG